MNARGVNAFDQWLGQELQRHASAQAGPSPMPAQAQYHAAYIHGAAHVPLLAKVGALLTTKAAVGLTVGVLAAAAAGAGEAVITGSTNPSDWGKQVVQQVQKCKGALAPGSHGIGDCVSSFASQHGTTVSNDHRATPRPAQGSGHTPGPPTNKAHPTPAVHPTPTDHAHTALAKQMNARKRVAEGGD